MFIEGLLLIAIILLAMLGLLVWALIVYVKRR